MKTIKLEMKKKFWGPRSEIEVFWWVSFLKSQQSKKKFRRVGGFLVSAIEKSTNLDPNKPKMQKKIRPSVRLFICHHDNSSISEPILTNLFLICEARFEAEQNRPIGSRDMGKKVVKLRCLRGFLRKSREIWQIQKKLWWPII